MTVIVHHLSQYASKSPAKTNNLILNSGGSHMICQRALKEHTEQTHKHERAYPQSLVDVVYQGKQLYKVIHRDGDDCRAKCGGGEGDEAALPLKSEDSK